MGREIDPESIRPIPGDKIFFVQHADALKIEMDLFLLFRYFRKMAAEGDSPIVEFMLAVAATSYDGPVSLEIFIYQFSGGGPLIRGGGPLTIARDRHRSLLSLMNDVCRLEPEIRLNITRMPPRSRCHGFEFIEFT